MKQKILITFNTARAMIKNARQFDVETGGVMVGVLGSPLTIVGAGNPGARAVHHVSSFTSDPIEDKQCIDKARQMYSDAIEPVGWWHKHPCDFDRPSSGDIAQVKQLIADFNDHRPVLIGIVNHYPGLLASRTTLRLYSLDINGQLVEHDWKLISSKNHKLMQAIKNHPTRLGTRQTDFWSDKAFQSYLNPIGRDRIKVQIDMLRRNRWQVKIARAKSSQHLILDVFNGRCTLRLKLPPEFPLNPPSVYHTDGRMFVGLESLSQWNSTCRLIDIVQEAQAIIHCAHCNRTHLRKPSIDNDQPVHLLGGHCNE